MQKLTFTHKFENCLTLFTNSNLLKMFYTHQLLKSFKIECNFNQESEKLEIKYFQEDKLAQKLVIKYML